MSQWNVTHQEVAATTTLPELKALFSKHIEDHENVYVEEPVIEDVPEDAEQPPGYEPVQEMPVP